MKARSLVALSISFASLAAGCSPEANAPDGTGDEATAERGEAITMSADMVWAGSPHDVITLGLGYDSESVVDQDSDSHEVYQVLVDPRAGTQDGRVKINRSWSEMSSLACLKHALSARVFVQVEGSLAWTQLKQVDLTSSFSSGSGEFPSPSCSAGTFVDFPANASKVRVMAQARTRVTAGTFIYYTREAVTVNASGTSPAPDLSADIKFNPDGGVSATITNTGPVTSNSVDSDLSYAYDYCPPPQGDEPPKCTLSYLETGTCVGSFCGPNTFVNYMRQPIRCSWSADMDNVAIGANGGVAFWQLHQPGVQARCGLCQPNDNRCANRSASVTARNLSSPYDQMPSVSDSVSLGGVF